MMTKAMLPMLKKSIGSRIINISSTAGHGSMAAMGAYSGNDDHHTHTHTHIQTDRNPTYSCTDSKLCFAALRCAVLCCAVLYCTVLYCTVLYCTVLSCVV